MIFVKTRKGEIYAHLMDDKLRASVNKLDFRRGPQLLERKT